MIRLTGWCIRSLLRAVFLVLWFSGWTIGFSATAAAAFGYLPGTEPGAGMLSQILLFWLGISAGALTAAFAILAMLLLLPLPCACDRS